MTPEILHTVRESVNESGRSFRAYFLSFVIIAFYILSIASSTSHELLFRSGSVVMPIINLSVPITWFFALAPWLILLLHINLIIQAIFLSKKLMHYNATLSDSTSKMEYREKERSLLIPVPIAHVLARSNYGRDINLLLNVFVISSFIVLPILCLSYLLIQFLPYQSETVTGLHRCCLFLDILILFLMWPRIVSPHLSRLQWWRRGRIVHFVSGISATLLLFLFSLATSVPGGFLDSRIPQFGLERVFLRHLVLPGRTLVLKEPAPEILASLFAECEASNRDTYIDCGKMIAPGSRQWCRHTKGLSLQNRRLRNGDFKNTILCGVNMEGTDLTRANFEEATLYSANFSNVNMYRTTLSASILNESSFSGASLIEADLEKAELRCVDFSPKHALQLHNRASGGRRKSLVANTQSHSVAKLHRANMRRSALHCAKLDYAELYGANLEEAQIFGTDLTGAKMHGANLKLAQIYAARLSKSKLVGVNLDGASIYGSDLTGAELTEAHWYRIDIRSSLLTGANVTGVKVRGFIEREQFLDGWEIVLSDLDKAICDRTAALQDMRLVATYGKSDNAQMPSTSLTNSYGNFVKWVQKRGDRNYFGHFKGSCWTSLSAEIESPWHTGSASWRQGFAEARRKFLLEQLACWDQSGYVAKSIIAETIKFFGVVEKVREEDAAEEGSCEGIVRGWRMYLSSIASEE